MKTGIDWFELDGTAEFEGKTAKLPDILKAIKRGETMVQLDDGSMGTAFGVDADMTATICVLPLALEGAAQTIRGLEDYASGRWRVS